MTAAIVIARIGSKRLPRKNLRPLCGIPLVGWTVLQSKCSREVDYVYLSTDDDEIAEVGRSYGATIIRRPDWPDADEVAANRVYLHALDTLEELGQLPEVMITLFPTSPLRKPGDIDKAVRQFRMVGGPHVYPCARNRETILMQDVMNLIAKGVIADKSYKYLTPNSGLCNVIKTSWYRWHTERMTDVRGDLDSQLDPVIGDMRDYPDTDSYYTLCEQWQCVETDTLAEFELAEVLMEHYLLKGRGPEIYHDYARGENAD